MDLPDDHHLSSVLVGIPDAGDGELRRAVVAMASRRARRSRISRSSVRDELLPEVVAPATGRVEHHAARGVELKVARRVRVQGGLVDLGGGDRWCRR